MCIILNKVFAKIVIGIWNLERIWYQIPIAIGMGSGIRTACRNAG